MLSSLISVAGGVCRFTVRVCGWEKPGATQDNWLFTKYISKDFDYMFAIMQ